MISLKVTLKNMDAVARFVAECLEHNMDCKSEDDNPLEFHLGFINMDAYDEMVEILKKYEGEADHVLINIHNDEYNSLERMFEKYDWLAQKKFHEYDNVNDFKLKKGDVTFLNSIHKKMKAIVERQTEILFEDDSISGHEHFHMNGVCLKRMNEITKILEITKNHELVESLI